MTVFDKLRATTSFGVVEVADSLFVDGRAYSKVSLTEIIGLKLPVANSYVLTGEEAGYDTAGNSHYNSPTIAMTRTAFIGPTSSIVSSGDSTISLCGKSYGTVNLAYDASSKYFYQIVKSKGSASTAKSSLIRFSKNAAEAIYKSWDLSHSTVAGTTNGTKDLLNSDFGTLDIFLKSMSDSVCLSLYTSIGQNQKPASGTYANSGLNQFDLRTVGPSLYWIDAFTTTNTAKATSVATDKRGNVYFVAHTVIGSNNSELVITRTDTYGNLTWQKSLGSTTNEYGYAIHADKDDNIYVAGATSTGAGGTTEAFLAKLTVDGTVTWQKSFGSAQSDVGYALASDSSGNVYLAGTALASFSEGDSTTGQLFVAKITSAGSITWQKTLSTATAQSAKSVAVDTSGNVYVVGYVDVLKNGSQAAYVLKLSSAGTYAWDKRIGNVALSAIYDTALDTSGNLIVVGKTVGSQPLISEDGDVLITEAGDTFITEAGSKADIFVAKITSAGAISWQKGLTDGTKSCVGYSISTDGANNFFIAATTTAGTSSVYIAKLDGTGTIAWQNSLVSNGTDQLGAISIAPTGEMVVLSTKTGSNQVVVSKLPATGALTGTYGSFTYQTTALTAYTPDSTLDTVAETNASTPVSNFLTAATPSHAVASLSLTFTQTSIGASNGGSTVQAIERSTGWLQTTYLDATNQNPWAIFASSQLYTSDATGTPVFAVNRTTGTKVALGNLHASKAGALGCFVSNAEQVGATNTVSFYGVKMAASGLSVQCATIDMSGATPAMASEACTLSNTSQVVGFDSALESAVPPESRRVRPFLMKDGSTFFLGVAVYDVTGKAVTPSPYKMYVFRITNKTALELVQALDISALGNPIAAMPMGDSQKTWLIAYSTKIAVFKWKLDGNFSKIEETDCANLSWIGVDSRQRIWFTDTGTVDGAGKQVSYYQPQGAAAPSAKSTFTLSFDDATYTYLGQDITTNLNIKYFLPNGTQAAQKVIINIQSENAKFQDNTFTKTTTTSSSGDTSIPVVIKGPGYVDITVTSTT